MASLFVIQGADQGKRFELKPRPMALGRDKSSPILLHDHEISRRHAEVRPVDDSFRIVDLGSANGTFVGRAGSALPEDPIPVGVKRELGPDDRVYVGAWTRLVVRAATEDEQAPAG